MRIRDPDSAEELTVPLPPPAPDQPLCALVALSDDPLLLEALAGAAGGAASVSSSPSTDRFVDQLVANGAAIALIDANCVAGSLKSFLTTLREQFPQLLLLLSGPAQLQAQVSAQIADGTLFRFVHKPASSQRLRLFLDAAMRQQAGHDANANAGAGGSGADGGMAMPIEARPDRQLPRASSGSRTGLIVAGVAGILLAAAVAAWLTAQHSSPGAPPSAADAVVEQPAADSDVTSAPPAAAPTPQPAGTEQSTPLNAAAQAARDAAALEQAQRNAQGARADQLAVYLQLARKRLTSGQLIDPPDDSARTYLDSALALAPEDPDVRATSLAFGEALIGQFRRALAAGDATEAQRWLAAGTSFHVGASTLRDMSAQLQQLRSVQQAAVHSAEPVNPPAAAATTPAAAPAAAPAGATAAATPAAATTPAAPVVPLAAPASVAKTAATAPAPAPANTGALPEIAPGVVSEASLTRVSFVTPNFPEEALADHTSGSVELEFTVTPEGKVEDVTVLSSEPRNVFDRAARSAIARSRYKPVLRDGAPVAQRARIRVRFQP
ncbi:MAG TPA: energy transducer TonB [Steroidobacteraceae bacterium]